MLPSEPAFRALFQSSDNRIPGRKKKVKKEKIGYSRILLLSLVDRRNHLRTRCAIDRSAISRRS